MSTAKEIELVAPCGLSCGHCIFYRAKEDPALAELMETTYGIPRDKVACKGCRPQEGKRPEMGLMFETYMAKIHKRPAEGNTCATYACSVEHGVDFCYECSEFPCVKLQPCVDGANFLPHNLKLFNLCCLKREGLAWLKNYFDAEGLFRFGKFMCGQGPRMTEDGLRTIQESTNQYEQIRDRLQQNAGPGKSQA